ncbi:hypothetical protein BSP4_03160 [Bacillus subtilis subsp. subtilis]|nr:hypothetical protein BSP4_03160 [Bacillus subtilis subsp. subtilis]
MVYSLQYSLKREVNNLVITDSYISNSAVSDRDGE